MVNNEDLRYRTNSLTYTNVINETLESITRTLFGNFLNAIKNYTYIRLYFVQLVGIATFDIRAQTTFNASTSFMNQATIKGYSVFSGNNDQISLLTLNYEYPTQTVQILATYLKTAAPVVRNMNTDQMGSRQNNSINYWVVKY